jgi:hypothetical protein
MSDNNSATEGTHHRPTQNELVCYRGIFVGVRLQRDFDQAIWKAAVDLFIEQRPLLGKVRNQPKLLACLCETILAYQLNVSALQLIDLFTQADRSCIDRKQYLSDTRAEAARLGVPLGAHIERLKISHADRLRSNGHQQLSQTESDDEFYVAQSTIEGSDYSGPFLVFWKKGGGYTTALDQALVFSRCEAQALEGPVRLWKLRDCVETSAASVHEERLIFGGKRRFYEPNQLQGSPEAKGSVTDAQLESV